MDQTKTALVVVMSNIPRDPRVRRQIDWLVEAGWKVDTVGLGEPADNVRVHFALDSVRRWVNTPFGTLLVYGGLPQRIKFKLLTQDRIPVEAQRRVRSGEYEIIVFNDRHFVPWVADTKTFSPAARAAHLHLDLHEYFVPTLKRDTLWRRITGSHYAWGRRLFAAPIFDSRSTVNNGIARLYEEELSVPEFAVIRNSPPFADLVPGPVDPHHIKLIHHGMASWDRGLREIVDAMRLLDARFSMTFMLLGSEEVISELKEYSADLADRIEIVPPAPMRELSSAVNRFDLEVMFYRPATRNLELALPNKLFEAVQGRLGLVAGRSPMMVDVINQHSNGVIVDGWEASDLAATLNALTAERVSELKSASHAAAAELSSEAERAVFLGTMGLDGAANRRASK